MNFMNNAFPNFSNDASWDVELSPTQADNVVGYQLAQPFPRYLDGLSLFVAQITDNKTTSRDIYKALLKHGLVLPAPPAGTPDDVTKLTVNTHGITNKFAHQFYKISVHAQRKLVAFLFFWEEECNRWRLLAEEKREIMLAMDREGSDNSDLAVALAAVEMKEKMLPSKRGEATGNVISGIGHELPSYA